MTHITKNQQGASILMLAIFFISIIAIITVGFATLARREQRAVLDKTLSKQAQYAAESGINSVKKYVSTVGSVNAIDNANCNPYATGGNITAANLRMPDFTNAAATGTPSSVAIKVSCLTWDKTPTEVAFKIDPNSNVSFNNQNATGFSLISWDTDGGTGGYGGLATPTNMPDLNANKNSVLKMVNVVRGDVYNTQKVVTTYFVPSSNVAKVTPAYTTPTGGGACPNNYPAQNDYVDLGDACIGTLNPKSSDGLVYYVPCSGSKCSIHVAGFACPSAGCGAFGATYKDRLFYFQNIGSRPITIEYSSVTNPYTASEAGTPLTNVAVKVDSNAISGDVSKRLVAYIPIRNEAWQPWFAAMADSLCKDYKVDGSSNNVAIAGANPNTCPNN